MSEFENKLYIFLNINHFSPSFLARFSLRMTFKYLSITIIHIVSIFEGIPPAKQFFIITHIEITISTLTVK